MLPPTLTITTWILLGFILILSAALLRGRQSKHGHKQPPPGPPALPVLGHLHMLGTLPHRTFLTWSKKYGPIMSLRLGQVPTIVISSADAAEQIFKAHDTTFVGRPNIEISKYLSYDSKGLVYAPYGPYWRSMRKVCTTHLLSASKVESFAPVRQREVEKAVRSLEKAAKAGDVVDLSELVQRVLEEIVIVIVLGGSSTVEKEETKELIQEGMRLFGAFNIGDYVPWLRPFDLQGLRQIFKKLSKATDELLENVIKEHGQARNAQNGRDFIDILLSLMHQTYDHYNEENSVIDITNIKGIAVDMIAGSFETTSTVIIWALSQLLKYPRVMKKLQDELSNVIGMNRMVDMSDLGKLSYLDMVIKESLRLYPAGSLIIRESIEDATINGYYIKKNSRVLVNLWAIGRDPKVWSDNAETFYPERFVGKNIDVVGSNFELLPFGSGRRRCPGMHLGLSTAKFVVSQLMHCFNWELPRGMKPDDLDMTETFGLSIPRATPLCAVPTYRLNKGNEKSN